MIDFKHEQEKQAFFEQHKGFKVTLLFFLLAFVVVLGVSTYAAAKLKQPYKQEAPVKTIKIIKGTSAGEVASLLEKERIINGDQLFIYYLWIKGAREKLQAGVYDLSASMTIPELVEKLTKGEVVSNEVRFRIAEGWTLKDVAERTEKEALGTKEEFYNLTGSPPSEGGRSASADLVSKYEFLSDLPGGVSLEGYLFPDTYFVSRAGGVEELVHKSLENFGKKISQLEQKRAQNRGLHEVITVASLVEGEVGRNVAGRALTENEIKEIEEERRIVSDIFWKRLNINMALQSDATIGYATGEAKRRATKEDTQIDSLYNTYKYPGLPPGPINNPSLAAIESAFNPTDTDYLYFLSVPDGKAYFGKTLEEHNINKEKYLE